LEWATGTIVLLPRAYPKTIVQFMGAPTKTLPDKQALHLDTGRRRSMRVLLSVPIQVTGKTKENEKFEEETRTLVVNAHGALISLAAKVIAGQHVSLNNRATQKSMDCRVVYVGNPAAGKMQMGVEFIEPCPFFWQIDFPPDDWIVPEN
jgi:hypothetical protein